MGDDPGVSERVNALMERVEKGEERLEVPDEVITETVWTLERYFEVPRSEIAEKLSSLINFRGIHASKLIKSVLLEALRLFARAKADFVDCLLAAKSKERKIPVYTLDEQDFKKLPAAWEKP